VREDEAGVSRGSSVHFDLSTFIERRAWNEIFVDNAEGILVKFEIASYARLLAIIISVSILSL
jgi:hypothetical protein